jgi:hypothetical protein
MLKRVGVKVCTSKTALLSCRSAASVDTLLHVLAAKRTDSDTVKTTVELPGELWRAAKIRAMDERADLRTVLIRALEDYLRDGEPERPTRSPTSP